MATKSGSTTETEGGWSSKSINKALSATKTVASFEDNSLVKTKSTIEKGCLSKSTIEKGCLSKSPIEKGCLSTSKSKSLIEDNSLVKTKATANDDLWFGFNSVSRVV